MPRFMSGLWPILANEPGAALAPAGVSSISAAIPQSTAQRTDLDFLAYPFYCNLPERMLSSAGHSKRGALATRAHARDQAGFGAVCRKRGWGSSHSGS